ncbi:dnaJ-like subfamily C member 30 [Silurus meridionalis]|nr:dnaJ-like subfamily C member 30 [Silurus meridionalis]
MEVCAVFRAGRRYGVSPGRCVNVWRSYRTLSTEEIPLYRMKSAYYDILQVSPSATQAQIKTAYYKQSFIYHPDKNAGSEHAASRFSQISEAYSVLGNKTLRKKYDGGFLSEADVRGSSRPAATKDMTSGSSSHVQRNRRSPEVTARSQTVFDFDTFYREHYGEQLQRQKHIRARLQEIKRQKEEAFQDRKLGLASEIAVGVMLAVAAAILFGMKSKG